MVGVGRRLEGGSGHLDAILNATSGLGNLIDDERITLRARTKGLLRKLGRRKESYYKAGIFSGVSRKALREHRRQVIPYMRIKCSSKVFSKSKKRWKVTHKLQSIASGKLFIVSLFFLVSKYLFMYANVPSTLFPIALLHCPAVFTATHFTMYCNLINEWLISTVGEHKQEEGGIVLASAIAAMSAEPTSRGGHF